MTNEYGLPIRPLGEAIADTPDEPEWIWDGYLAPGAVTDAAGRPKVGKTTLTFGVLKAVTTGTPFAGRPTRKTGVLLLTEERHSTLAEKARRFDLNGSVDVLMRHEAGGQPWPQVVEQATAHCREHGHGLLVVDTFDKWVGLRGDDENKSGPVLEALEPLIRAAGEGLAVLIVSHQRKSPGAHGEALRGSNALAGAVDIIVEVERVPDVAHARVLLGTSRFAGTPEELALELGDDGYTAHGDSEALKAKLYHERILDHLGDEPLVADDIAEALEMPKGTVHKRLGQLHEQGRVERSGRGRKGDPFRWRILSSQAHPLVTNESSEPDGPSPEWAERLAERYRPDPEAYS